MKTSVKIVLFLAVIFSCVFLFTSCEEKSVDVENVVSFNDKFEGDRTITLHVGQLLSGRDDLKAQLDEIIDNNTPSVFETSIDETEEGLKYNFKLSFTSEKDYENKISSVLGQETDVQLSTPDNTLTKGWRYVEDFDGMELISFIANAAVESNYKDLLVTYNSISNVVNFDGKVKISDTSIVDISDVSGFSVTDISIDTTNNKQDSYDRRFTITFPQTTYDKMGEDLLTLMEERTDELADYSGWTQQGNNQEFQVFYKGVSLVELQAVTSKFLDCDSQYLYYGDENNSSTPLAEQLVFEERFNLLSFISVDGKTVPITYKYSLPIKTTYGDGLVLEDGSWDKNGKWIDGVYTLSSSNESVAVRVPDGMQYKIDGVAVTVENLGDNKFVREFDFLYDKNSGVDGCNYASNYFQQQGVKATVTKNDVNLICSVKEEGTTQEIDKFFKELLGEDNEFLRTENTSAMAVVTDLKLVDSVNITNMLNEENMNITYKYTMKNKGQENIISLDGQDNSEDGEKVSSQLDKNGDYVIELQGGENTIELISTVPYQDGIITYSVIAGVMLLLTGVAIVLLLRKSKGLKIFAFNKKNGATDESANEDKEDDVEQITDENIKDNDNEDDTLYKYYDDEDLL